MQAWLLPGYTGIESMTLGEAPEPTPAPGQVILALQFAALNPADRYLSIGQYPAKPIFPHILGRDGIGTVLSIGQGVTGIQPGDIRLILRSDVGVNRPGTLAQRVAVDAAYTTSVPSGWSLEQSAAAPLVYITAWQALTQWGDLPSNPTILINGASGGVGVASVQLAHAMGYTVIALSRNEEKSQRLHELGAHLIFNPTDRTWRDQLKSQLDSIAGVPTRPLTSPTHPSSLTTHHSPRRVDLAIDNIGGPLFNELLEVMAMHGRISCVGRLAGPVPNFNTAALFFRRLRIGGVAIGTYTNAETHAAWQSVLQTLEKSPITPKPKPIIDHIFTFNQVPAAFTRLAQGPLGKILIQIPQP